MTLLHAYLQTKNQQAFQRLLDTLSSASSAAPAQQQPSSGGRSWTRPSNLSSSSTVGAHICDINARDSLGRTALHLACSSLQYIEYVRALLKHPSVDVNMVDTESHWTALHRALYNANFPAALLLLQRTDTDASLKDLEGYTAFDLYNSTVNGSKPDTSSSWTNAQLFTWGANRNAALGLGDGDDRTYPDQVAIQPKGGGDDADDGKKSLAARFEPIMVRQIQMSKLHTAIVTSEGTGNIRVCGFGSGGRLGGLGQHTQYGLKPLPDLSVPIASIALGQDHTLALTKSGEILSWGLNRFSQLGYVVETPTAAATSNMGMGMGRLDEPIQATPKKVNGLLRKELVKGVAASKVCSACWTEGEVYTWGTNYGQLGYDRAAQPVQVFPRKVTQITKPVIAISITDTTMACLLVTQQVECIWNDRHFRINFPGHAFPSEIQPYRPPQAVKDAHIAKITSCDETFAALSSNGEVFLFSATSPDVPSDPTTTSSGSTRTANSNSTPTLFKPQRVWALRKQFSAVKDVALGSDGSIIICTESGHVFTRTRTPSSSSSSSSASGKAFKFHRVPYIQRVVQVCANSTGAFGALRVDFKPGGVQVCWRLVSEDLGGVVPFLKREVGTRSGEKEKEMERREEQVEGIEEEVLLKEEKDEADDDDGDGDGDGDVKSDIKGLKALCDVLIRERESRRSGGDDSAIARLPYGADCLVTVQSGASFPVHRVILAARSASLCAVLSGTTKVIKDGGISIRLLASSSRVRLSITGCHAISVLILMQYLYSDDLLAIWDRRVHTALERSLKPLKIVPAQIKLELQCLARILDLPVLSASLEPPVKRKPAPTMAHDLNRLFEDAQHLHQSSSPLAPDVVLQLSDKDVLTHSVILRSRTELFASFFDDEEWTRKRWDAYGMIKVNMKHLDWNVMQYVLRFVCCGADEEMFHALEFAESVDDVLHFMFDVMAAANELLLDRLVLICSSVILAHSNLQNACYILADATHFHAQQLVERLQSYMTVNIEALLEGHMLDDIPYALVKQLAMFARQKQEEKSPISRSGLLVDAAMVKQADWLALQDIPEPIIVAAKPVRLPLRRDVGSKLSPPSTKRQVSSPQVSPILLPQRTIRRPPSGDDIFIMDDADVPALVSPELPAPPAQVWKATSKPRVDMKTVMAEAAISAQRETPNTPPRGQPAIGRKAAGDMPHTPPPSHNKGLRPSTASPWRTPDQRGLPSSPGTPSATASPSAVPRVVASSAKLTSSTASGLGPVITPTRQPVAGPSSSSSTVRHPSGGKAWTLPPVQPITAPSLPPRSGMSFVAIQHAQLEQEPPEDKRSRSLREIQEEEKARRDEADFLKWWSGEEERVRLEAEALEMFASAGTGTGVSAGNGASNSKGKAPRRYKGRGGGGGGGGGKKADALPAAGEPRKPPRSTSTHETTTTTTANTTHHKPQPRKPSRGGNAAA